MVGSGQGNDPVAAGIFSAVRYFSLFRHPLTAAEIHRFHPVICTAEEVEKSLSVLVQNGTIVRSRDGLYAPPGMEEWFDGRRASRSRALGQLERSKRYSRIIASFPFVRAVALSGSLSKYAAGEEADIDYFIITAENRLWIARTLLHLFKKLTFLTGHQHCFCMNYFIDAGALELDDHNIYTAIEMATLLPAFNAPLLQRLADANPWVFQFLPNSGKNADLAWMCRTGNGWGKSIAEGILGLLAPERLNRLLMRLTDRKWRRKWARRGFPMAEYDEAFRTTLHLSKNHPANFRKQVLTALAEN